MAKGNFTAFLRGSTTHRVPKLATLVAASAVLATMITIDASATPATLTGVGGAALSRAALAPHLATLTDVAPGRGGHRGTRVAVRHGATTTTTRARVLMTGPRPGSSTAPQGPVRSAPTPADSGPAAPTTTTTTPAPTTTTTAASAPTTTTTTPAPTTAFPMGTPDGSEPSGYAPPAANALAGYTETYVTDFPGTSVPAGWDVYHGNPSSDPGAQFGSAHVTVSNGILSLSTWHDPAYGGEWVTGGLSTNIPQTYGADFVRSRVTGAGPTMVELLWPANNQWPPEIDFAESGGDTSSISATVHWGTTSSNHQDQRVLSGIDLSQWHTWGVIWTPTSITYTVDGRVWGRVNNTGEIPNVPMTLDLQQQTWCGASPAWACPSGPQSMEVDWVAEYTSNS